MKPSSDVTGLYRNFPAYLWVEDEETRTYLQTAWEGELHIKVLVAGGHGHLHAVVNAARNDYNTHVFGFRDRDFGGSNRARWNEDAVVVLTADVVEIENLLLDPDAIAACQVNTSGLNAAQVEQELTMLATPLTWWMEILRDLTTRIWTRKRPKDPECRLTFVQEIARAQLDLNRVPQEIRELRTAIRRRIGH